MTGMNKVFLMGNLTRDPELRFTPQGTAFTQFSVAVNRSFKDNDGTLKKFTDFFTTVVWGKQAENCAKYLTKGRPVHVEGRLQNRSFETTDKQKRKVTEIVALSVQFLNGRANPYGGQSVDPDPEPDDATPLSGSDEVPF